LGSQRDLQQQSITMESRNQRRFGTQQQQMTTSINIKHVPHMNTMIFSPPLGTKIRVSAGIKVNFNPKKDA
jgi:plastocyanin